MAGYFEEETSFMRQQRQRKETFHYFVGVNFIPRGRVFLLLCYYHLISVFGPFVAGPQPELINGEPLADVHYLHEYTTKI